MYLKLGNAAVNPLEANKDVILGHTAVLSIYVAGDPVLASSEIVWRDPNWEHIAGERFDLVNANTRLVISNVQLEDSGDYRIDIIREVVVGSLRSFASTTIDLNVQGMQIQRFHFYWAVYSVCAASCRDMLSSHKIGNLLLLESVFI